VQPQGLILASRLYRQSSFPKASSLLLSPQIGRTALDRVDSMDESPDNNWLSRRSGQFCQNTQIYEGTNKSSAWSSQNTYSSRNACEFSSCLSLVTLIAVTSLLKCAC
jgi:hypothetical protein